MRLIKFSLVFVFIITSFILQAQTGFIRGTVFDDSNGETLPGSTIIVEGTTVGVITDLDGNFNISIEPGIYTLRVSFISYEALVITDVEVKVDDVTILDNVRLKEAKIELGEVTVTAKQIRNTDAALNTIKMKSANLLDGISSTSLKKIGDSDAAASMKRVPGVSVEGGKYVYVRGLGDRYSKTTLNGLDIPGLDPDKNTIQMDIFPTNIIDNLIVHKSFSAELPADFTGGVIDIELKGFPEKRQGAISVSAGYNPNFHFNENYLTYKGGSTDWLGFDDGTREIPTTKEDIPEYSDVFLNPTSEDGLFHRAILEGFSPTMAAMKEKSFMDYGIGLSYGNQHPLDKITIGYNFSFSYKNNTEFYEDAEFGRYSSNPDVSANELVRNDLRIGDFGVNSAFLSGLAGLALKTKHSKYRVYILHLQSGESKAGIFDYEASDLGTTFKAFQHALDYSQRSLSNVFIDGKHSFGDDSWNIEWKFSPSVSKMTDPDIRFTRYAYVTDGLTISPESGYPERNWRYLDETDLAGALHVMRNFNFNGQKAKLKFGGAYTRKERSFSMRLFQIDFNGYELTGDPNELFLEENLWPVAGNGRVGTTFNDASHPSKNYDATVDYMAGYASVELNVLQKLKTILGVRYENFIQYYTGQNQKGDHVLDNDKVLDNTNFFPSVNLVYNLTEKQNLRFSYSQTIARPSMKELSYAEIYDPISGVYFFGGLSPIGEIWNGDLKSTDIQNLDLRWELFQDAGQMVSVSAFYKSFLNPIEMVQSAISQKPTVQPRNVGDGNVMGIELELRQALSLFSPRLNNFSFMGNFTYAKSEIKLSKIEYETRITTARDGQTIKEYRDMAGMSPYIINAGIAYNGGTVGFWNGLEAGLYYNVQGKTLYIVGIADLPDVYTNPFHSLNFNSSKRFGKDNRFNVGLKIENILNSNKEYVYQAYEAEDQYYEKLQKGITFEVKFGYSF